MQGSVVHPDCLVFLRHFCYGWDCASILCLFRMVASCMKYGPLYLSILCWPQVRQMAPDDYLPENWMNFPGSQPVSLDRQNMTRLQHERYRVTWKADGTRYMLMMLKWGTYLVDRSLKVRRVQVQ